MKYTMVSPHYVHGFVGNRQMQGTSTALVAGSGSDRYFEYQNATNQTRYVTITA